jgi:poly-gamma-glutamate capsule biosynthesis protein CapA/YwtB (metallophosphatase superfamily)
MLSRQIDIPLTVNARDEERILRSIRSAAKQADFVILHSHDIAGSGELSPAPAHLPDFYMNCIDAGADAVSPRPRL